MTLNESRLWQSMMARSFEPHQWFLEDGNDDSLEFEERVMWVYRRVDSGYSVGFFDPNGTWHNESDWPTRDLAAVRVNFLNGGKGKVGS